MLRRKDLLLLLKGELALADRVRVAWIPQQDNSQKGELVGCPNGAEEVHRVFPGDRAGGDYESLLEEIVIGEQRHCDAYDCDDEAVQQKRAYQMWG